MKIQTGTGRDYHRGLVLLLVPLLCILFYLGSCLQEAREKTEQALQIALDWNQFVLDAEVNTEGYRGPVAARAYAYVGLAAYEAALPGMAGNYKSLANIDAALQLPAHPKIENFNLPVALHSAYNTMLMHFFMGSPQTIKDKQVKLKSKWDAEFASGLSPEVYEQSSLYGIAVAEAIYAWSSTDTLGKDANLHNYDRTYKPPIGEGKWVTSVYFPMPALLPYWGGVRTFMIDPDEYVAKPLPPYSNIQNEFYYKQALEVLTLSKPLSAENKWIADFWNDDRPGITFSPAGHWLAITNQVIEMDKPSIEKALETYLKIGFALSDASVACWKAKYLYSVERPESFIQNHLDKEWRPYSPTPPFPSYPSGHSMMGAAAANVLATMYGDNYKLMDCSHQGLSAFATKPRTFKSFEEMSRENALSRMLMGVHYRMDCEEGLRLGELIGQKVASLKLEEQLSQ